MGAAASDHLLVFTDIELPLACYPACDPGAALGVPDIFDFLCFQDTLIAGEPYACDCDRATGPAVCDLFDFLCYQDAFAAGCR